MSEAMSFSHVGMFVEDLDGVVNFYQRYMGFAISDEGVYFGSGRIVFMTRNPEEHHQIVFANVPGEKARTVVQQLSFKVDDLAELKRYHRRLQKAPVIHEGPNLGSVTHGNAVSHYFRDPAGNRIEIFFDTEWYVHQPMRLAIDLTLPDAELWKIIEAHARSQPGFTPRAAWQADLKQKIARAAAEMVA
ncbi:MAG: VOC family protein [Burkholderiales bacterium]